MICKDHVSPFPPSDAPLRFSSNERAWIEFLRLLSCGTDPAPTLKAIQALRQALQRPSALP